LSARMPRGEPSARPSIRSVFAGASIRTSSPRAASPGARRGAACGPTPCS
jgi:hypothetical protein